MMYRIINLIIAVAILAGPQITANASLIKGNPDNNSDKSVKSTEVDEIEPMALIVNGEGVPQKEVDDLVRFAIDNMDTKPTYDERFNVKINIINSLIMARVIKQKAFEADIPVSATEVDILVDLIRSNTEHEEGFLKSLADQAVTINEFRRIAENELKVRKFEQSIMDEFEVYVTPGDLEDWYDDHKDAYRTPEMVKMSQIVLEPASETNLNRIKKIREQIVVLRQDFSEMALMYSHSITSASGGYVGTILKGMLTSEKLETAIFNLPVGQVSPPIKTDNAWHLVKVDSHSPERQLTLDEAIESGVLEYEYVKFRKAEYFTDWLGQQRTKTTVEYLDPEIIKVDR